MSKGISARRLILVFLAWVAVCALFFSLGFLVGYNERSSKGVAVTERVTGPSVIPPTVNPPAGEPAPADDDAAHSAAPTTVQATPVKGSEGPSAASSEMTAASARGSKSRESWAAESTSDPGHKTTLPTSQELRTSFTVQVTASRTRQDAEALVGIVKARGYPVFLLAPDRAHANDELFRVEVGPFASRDKAEKVRGRLAKEGLFKDLFIKH